MSRIHHTHVPLVSRPQIGFDGVMTQPLLSWRLFCRPKHLFSAALAQKITNQNANLPVNESIQR